MILIKHYFVDTTDFTSARGYSSYPGLNVNSPHTFTKDLIIMVSR